jgi:hypothetical protein
MDLLIASTNWIPGPAKVIFVVLAVAFIYSTRPGQVGRTISSWSIDYPKQQAERLNSEEKSNVV